MNGMRPLTPGDPRWQIPLGALVANTIGGVLLAAINRFVRANIEHDISTFVLWPSFFFLPFLIGLIASWFWRRLDRTLGWSFLDALWVTLLGLLAAAIVLLEGTVCIIIVSPVLYIFILCGVLLGRIWFRPDQSKLQLTIFPVLALITLGEVVYHSEQSDVVTDRIVINAPPAKVWPRVLAFPEIPGAPDYWIFRLGLPYRPPPRTGATSLAPTGNAFSATAS
jgi:hypothetical protein